MCGRYYLTDEDTAAELREMINALNRRRMERLPPAMGEVFPTDRAPVVANSRKGAVMPFVMQWGFARPDGNGVIINARSETALERPMFRGPMLERRCLVPASGYYEWEKRGKRRVRYAISVPGGGPIYMAGIYRYENGQPLPAFSILTRAAAPKIAFIHDRMPVLLGSKELQAAWLDSRADARELIECAATDVAFREMG